jgi:anti-anti-sigma factor
MLATVPGCEFEVERGPDWLLVRIVNLDPEPSKVASLSENLWSLLERHLTYRLLLQLDGAPVLGSYLLGQLLKLRQRIAGHSGLMRLCSLSPENHRVLHTSHLDEVFLPYQSREEAVMGGDRPHRENWQPN